MNEKAAGHKIREAKDVAEKRSSDQFVTSILHISGQSPMEIEFPSSLTARELIGEICSTYELNATWGLAVREGGVSEYDLEGNDVVADHLKRGAELFLYPNFAACV